MKQIHKKYLLIAHSLANKHFGKTFPNPSVGCVLVRNKKILAKYSTGINGRPHAEELTLKKAGEKTIGSTMYVTLEPCYHNSLNNSCVNQIINSGIKKIFIATNDPDLRTCYKSIKKLKKNNVKVNVGITKKETLLINRFFYINKKKERSYVKYKFAVSKNYKIAHHNYKSKWISNCFSRKFSHSLRFKSDAILTTYSTIKYDNPRLTIRLNNYSKYKNTIIILDSKLEIQISSKILKSSYKRKIIIFTFSKNYLKIKKLKKINCSVIVIKSRTKLFKLKNILKNTYKLGICSILVEAGSKLFTYMYDNNLIDEFHLFVSLKKIGNNGIPMYLGKKNLSLKSLNSFLILKRKFNKDMYYHYNI